MTNPPEPMENTSKILQLFENFFTGFFLVTESDSTGPYQPHTKPPAGLRIFSHSAGSLSTLSQVVARPFAGRRSSSRDKPIIPSVVAVPYSISLPAYFPYPFSSCLVLV